LIITSSGEQSASVGTYCWFPLGVCAGVFIANLNDTDSLTVVRNTSIKLKLGSDVTPLSLKGVLRKPVNSQEEYVKNMSKFIVENIQLSPNKDTSFLLNVDPGEYILTIHSNWQEGDVEFNFKVKVE